MELLLKYDHHPHSILFPPVYLAIYLYYSSLLSSSFGTTSINGLILPTITPESLTLTADLMVKNWSSEKNSYSLNETQLYNLLQLQSSQDKLQDNRSENK